ncbi:MAG TPA: hypothetical protein VLX92_16040 [Kofleriaceae bacterium]|nr:hypothetical protein [Kofleriaceae bacterium]
MQRHHPDPGRRFHGGPYFRSAREDEWRRRERNELQRELDDDRPYIYGESGRYGMRSDYEELLREGVPQGYQRTGYTREPRPRYFGDRYYERFPERDDYDDYYVRRPRRW